jgi:hypothetical protein
MSVNQPENQGNCGMNGDMVKSNERKAWNTPVLENIQGVADVRTATKGNSTDGPLSQSS